MAATRTGIAIELESPSALRVRDRRRGFAPYPKPGLSREFFLSLAMCFPITCMLWAAIIYGAVRLAQ
jgi:hypothetical protein